MIRTDIRVEMIDLKSYYLTNLHVQNATQNGPMRSNDLDSNVAYAYEYIADIYSL